MAGFVPNPTVAESMKNLGPISVRVSVAEQIEKMAADTGIARVDLIRQMIDYTLKSSE
jgi:hypothetical protein